MTKVKLISAAVIALATIATPALAREHHVRVRHHSAVVYANAGPGSRYGTYGGYTCVPAPRVGAFATQPWTDQTPCEPYPMY